jgi:uncharacterized protein (DUF362 family)
MSGAQIQTTVALVQSEVRDASEFDYPEIRRVVQEAVSLAGGLTNIIKDGDVVVLKPNIVATRGAPRLTFLDFDAYRPNLQIQKEMNGITTDYRVTKAVVELVREINPSGKVYVMEGSAWGQTEKNFKLMGYDHDNIPGVDRFISLDDTSRYACVDSDDLVAVDLGEKGRYPASRMPHYTGGSYYFDRTYFEADVLISIPVLKNHLYTGMSGGIKNVSIGATPCMVYGNDRNQITRIKKIHHSWGPLNDWIHDYYLCRPVDFVVTDGLQGSQNGPRAQGSSSVENALMNMRLILAGKDAVAVDAIHSYIVGIDAQKVDHLRELAASGAGVIDTRHIVVKGNRRVDEVKKSFRLSRILAVLFRGRKSQYRDFEPPEFELVKVTMSDNRLSVDAKTGPNVTKVELFIDGELSGIFSDGFDHIEVALNGSLIEGAREATFYAYDRYLNCSFQTTRLGVKTDPEH